MPAPIAITPWDRAAPILARAIARQDTHAAEDIKAELDAGRAQLWCGTASALVTEIVVHPRRRVCRIWLAAGDMTELVHEMLPDVEAWAAAQDCDAMELVGRHGWARVLESYHQPHTVLVKELSLTKELGA